MKKAVLAFVVLHTYASMTLGQTPMAKPLAVKGTMDIRFDSRVQIDDAGKPLPGVVDTYKLDIAAADTAVFRGTVKSTPGIFGDMTGRIKQQAILQYAIDLLVRNPVNLSEERMIGRLVGGVPIDGKGVYQYGQGTLRIAVDAAGKASGFESAFRGAAIGKPLKSSTTLDKIKQQAMTLTRQVQGKTVKLTLSNYDKMVFQGLTMAAGPVKTYPEVNVNGEMLYDYERSAWYFNGVQMTYMADGKSCVDKLSGNIKWVESPNRKSTGEGRYVFDVRVNEKEKGPGGEAAVFAGTDDEAAFFSIDNSIAGLTGEARYKDTFSGDTVTASTVTIDLVGNQLNKVQVINLTKLLWLVSVVPFNAE